MNCGTCGARLARNDLWCWLCYAPSPVPVRDAVTGSEASPLGLVPSRAARGRSGDSPLSDTGTVFLLFLFALWFFTLRPAFLGGKTSYAIVNGVSMLPTLRQGDLVIVRRHAAYQVGEIIAYRIPDGEPGAGAIIIHRIVGGSPDAGYLTKGDNKPAPDVWRPTQNDVVGERWVRIARAGSALAYLRAPLPLATVVAVPLFIAIFGAHEARHVRRRRTQARGR